MTRDEFAARLGVTAADIKRRESVGFKPAKRNQQRQPFYLESQIEDYIARFGSPTGGLPNHMRVAYNAKEAKAVFEELEKKSSLIDIVKKTEIHPRIVRSIAEDYASLEGGMFIPQNIMDAINRLPLDGVFPIVDPGEIFRLLKDASEEVCDDCRRRMKSLCKPCAVKFAEKVGDI